MRSICTVLDVNTDGTKSVIIERLINDFNLDKLREASTIEPSKKPIIKKIVVTEVKTKKKAKEKIPATVRNLVWLKFIGDKNQGNCLCCSEEIISRANFQCGHIIAEKNGGEVTVDNLRPICGSCNGSMGTQNMEDFIKKHKIPKNKDWDGIERVSNVITNKSTKQVVSDSTDSSDFTVSSDDSSEELNERLRKINQLPPYRMSRGARLMTLKIFEHPYLGDDGKTPAICSPTMEFPSYNNILMGRYK